MLRPYQNDLVERCFDLWNQDVGAICMVLPTGGGKTLTFSEIVRLRDTPTVCIAHRQELVLQISESLARFGISHQVIAPAAVQKYCSARHLELFERNYVEVNAKVAVAGVQTLLRRADTLSSFIRQVRFWVQDECHHMLPDNQWGRAAALFNNAKGLGVTATPLRLDRQGLDGCFNELVVGPTMRELINDGYLAEYRIFCPPASVNRAQIEVSRSGEFRADSLRDVTGRSQIVGDVVDNYMRLAAGKRGLVFTVDVEGAERQAQAFRQAGVPAKMLSAQSSDRERVEALDELKRGDVKVITNVDLFGEGFDCPALEVVHMARPTQSYGLYVQQFGRALRPLEGKTHGILIDHVNNVLTHGLPDAPRQWSLAGVTRQETDPDDIPLRACAACLAPYTGYRVVCPYCGFAPEPAGRTTLQEVDGDLEELDPQVLAQMRGDVINIESGTPVIPLGAAGAVIGRKNREWQELCQAQEELRDVVSVIAGAWKHGDGLSDREIHRRFYLTFGMSIIEACALRRAASERLTSTMRAYLS